jgi:hypothetical protein
MVIVDKAETKVLRRRRDRRHCRRSGEEHGSQNGANGFLHVTLLLSRNPLAFSAWQRLNVSVTGGTALIAEGSG